MTKKMPEREFDAIVIGSGIGGLTVAGLLAKLHHQKVLVLEQHFTPGGFTHGFARQGKFHWDVGLHYVGQMHPGSTGRQIFDYLSDGNLQWQKMPDPFEKFVYPDFTFEVYSDPERFQTDLINHFPEEKAAIQRYFQDVGKATFWFITHGMVELGPKWLQPLLKWGISQFGSLARETTQAYLDKHFQDPRLKALLASQWADYGLSPARSSFGIHSLIVNHYLQGGWYPVGGGTAIAETLIPVIEEYGGAVLTQKRVEEVLLESGEAKGVRVENLGSGDAERETYHAPVVISDAGAINSYLKLLPQDYSLPVRKEIENFPTGSTVLTLYLGFKENPRQLGFQGENHWIYTTYNHEAIAEESFLTRDSLPQFAYLSFPSLKDPLAEAHTAEIITHANYDFFWQWRDQPWRRRGEEYKQLKREISDSLLELVEKHYPGFRDLVEYAELSTPLTVEHFDASDRGAIYGLPCVPERLKKYWFRAKTPVKNFYLTGSDAFSPGIMGAMMGGVKTVGLLQGPLGFFKVMGKIKAGARQA